VEKFEVAIVNPEPQERSRVEIRKTSDGEEEIVAIFSVLEKSRRVIVKQYGEFPNEARRKAFEKL
jgi:hypothetical protein